MTDSDLIREGKRRVAPLAWPLKALGAACVAAAVVQAVLAVPSQYRDGWLFLAGLMLVWGGWTYAAGWSVGRLRRPWAVLAGLPLATVSFAAAGLTLLPPVVAMAAVPFVPMWLLVLAARVLTDDMVEAGFAAVARRDADPDEDDA